VVALNEIVRSEKTGNSVGAFPVASAPLRQTKTEIFSLHFLIFSAPHFFLLIGDEKFSVLIFS
jgi:hypothetical protein